MYWTCIELAAISEMLCRVQMCSIVYSCFNNIIILLRSVYTHRRRNDVLIALFIKETKKGKRLDLKTVVQNRRYGLKPELKNGSGFCPLLVHYHFFNPPFCEERLQSF